MSADDEVAGEWIWKAERDLEAARRLAEIDLGDVAVYHCQQCAEKAVKGFLAFRRQRNQKTHDIPALLVQAEALSPGFGEFSEHVGLLCDWSFQYRYPEGGVREVPEPADVERAIEYAAAILAFAQSRIVLPEDADNEPRSLH